VTAGGLFDTSVFIAFEQRRSLAPLPAAASVSVIVLEELHLGVLTSAGAVREQRRHTLKAVQARYLSLPVDAAVAAACAEIRADGWRRGRRYAPFDSLIGATARVHRLPLYTRDDGFEGMLGVEVVRV
jgi:predicted nucleic acid-binding protein